jgi:hypothetical protein
VLVERVVKLVNENEERSVRVSKGVFRDSKTLQKRAQTRAQARGLPPLCTNGIKTTQLATLFTPPRYCGAEEKESAAQRASKGST